MRAAITTFLAMAYIIFVNPAILSNAIDFEGAFPQLLTVTARFPSPWPLPYAVSGKFKEIHVMMWILTVLIIANQTGFIADLFG